MPLVCRSIVVDPNWRAKACAAVGAARNHHIRSVAVTRRPHAGQCINVVVSRPAGTVHPQELLADQSSWIHVSANHAAAHVHRRHLIKRWRLVPNLCIGRADTPEAASAIIAADEEVAVASYVKCSPTRRIRQAQRTLPCNAAIGGTIEQAARASSCRAPGLVLESVAGAIRSINCEPLLVPAPATSIRLETQPRLAAIGRAVDVVTKRL